MYLTGMTQRSMYGDSYRVKDDVTGRTSSGARRRDQARGRRRPRPALAKPRPHPHRQGAVHGCEHRDGLRRGRRRRLVTAEKIVIAVGTRPARPKSVDFNERTVLDSDGILHLEKIPDAPGRRGGGDRDRVRVDVRGARIEGDRRRGPAPAARLLRCRDRRGTPVPPPRPERGAPARGGGGRRRRARRRDDHASPEREANPRRHRPLLRGPAGRDRRARPRNCRDRGRLARPDQRRRALPDVRRAHLRRRRRHRLPQPGRDVDGAGPAGRRPTPAGSR